MPSRPELVADAAVTVIARDGLRGLTHRAVDAEAGVPDGSTSNCYRSRVELLRAVVARLEELDRAELSAGALPDSTSTSALAAYLAHTVKRMTTRRHLRTTRARIALLLDDTARPALEEGHLGLLAMLEDLLGQAGHREPAVAARAVSDLLEGALVHAVTVRRRKVDVEELTHAVARLLG